MFIEIEGRRYTGDEKESDKDPALPEPQRAHGNTQYRGDDAQAKRKSGDQFLSEILLKLALSW